MKLDRRYLGLLIVTALAIAYTGWVFTRPAPQALEGAPGVKAGGAGSPATTTTASATDPATIAAPPRVDLATPPTWSRNPFAPSHRASVIPVSAAPSAVADPIVRSILYSAQRRAALVDDRVVGVGDKVTAGRVIAIERDAVVVQTMDGQQRRFALRRQALAGAVRR